MKTSYRFVAPPLQNETASLGFILIVEDLLGDMAFRPGTPSGTRTLDTLIKSQVLYQLS